MFLCIQKGNKKNRNGALKKSLMFFKKGLGFFKKGKAFFEQGLTFFTRGFSVQKMGETAAAFIAYSPAHHHGC